MSRVVRSRSFIIVTHSLARHSLSPSAPCCSIALSLLCSPVTPSLAGSRCNRFLPQVPSGRQRPGSAHSRFACGSTTAPHEGSWTTSLVLISCVPLAFVVVVVIDWSSYSSASLSYRYCWGRRQGGGADYLDDDDDGDDRGVGGGGGNDDNVDHDYVGGGGGGVGGSSSGVKLSTPSDCGVVGGGGGAPRFNMYGTRIIGTAVIKTPPSHRQQHGDDDDDDDSDPRWRQQRPSG